MKGILIAAGVILLVYIFFESRSAVATPAGLPVTAPPPSNVHGAAVGLQSLETPGAMAVNTTAAAHACAGCAVSPTSNAIVVGRFGTPSRAPAPAPPRLALPLTYHPASLEAPISHFNTRANAAIIANKTQTRIGWGA